MIDPRTRRKLAAHGVVLRVGFPPLVTSLLRHDILAITFRNRIWLSPRLLEMAPGLLDPILRHELVHVEQYRRDGLIRFLVRYASEYVSGRFSGLSHWEAYRAISYEREAAGEEVKNTR